jgi:uncharacterized SAM-binding protein YcdF (DUF218 family)
MMAVGIIGVLDTIILSTYTNINVGTLFPGAVGCLLIFYVVIKLRYRRESHIIANPLTRKLFCCGLIIAVLSFTIIETIIVFNSSSQEEMGTDYLIILGAGVNGDAVSLTLQERLLKGIEYLNKHNNTKVIVSGGQGYGENITEAEAMKKYLVSSGIDANRIIEENRSTSTMENFRFSKEILKKESKGNTQIIMVITSDFHMLRAKMLARRVGFEPYGITCSTPVSVRLNSYAREYFALVKSYFIDR